MSWSWLRLNGMLYAFNMRHYSDSSIVAILDWLLILVRINLAFNILRNIDLHSSKLTPPSPKKEDNERTC